MANPVTTLLSRRRPLLMGILNLTPDSFSDGAPDATCEDHLAKAFKLIKQGCHVLDIGGESTRPGAEEIGADEEVSRVLPFLEKFRKKFPDFPISLDTRKFEVAKAASQFSIQILNDVSFLSDERLLDVAGECGLYYALMHSRGTPQTMSKLADYPDGLLPTIFAEIFEKIETMVKCNFPRARVILDPGFGFAKTPEQCMALMETLESWKKFEMPLMIGVSRKRFLQKYTGENLPCERDDISAKLAAQACQAGFKIIRTHNVALTFESLTQIS